MKKIPEIFILLLTILSCLFYLHADIFSSHLAPRTKIKRGRVQAEHEDTTAVEIMISDSSGQSNHSAPSGGQKSFTNSTYVNSRPSFMNSTAVSSRASRTKKMVARFGLLALLALPAGCSNDDTSNNKDDAGETGGQGGRSPSDDDDDGSSTETTAGTGPTDTAGTGPTDSAGTGPTDDGGTGPVIPDDTAGTEQTDDGETGPVIPDDSSGGTEPVIPDDTEPVDSNGGTGNVIPDDTAGTGQTDDGGTGPVIPDDTAGTGQTDDGGTGNVIPDDTAGTGPTDTGGTGPTDTGGTGPTDTGGTGPTDTGGTGTGGTDPVDDCSRTSDPATGDPIVDAALELQTKTSEVICRQWLLNPDRKNALGLLSSYYNQGLPGDPSQSVPVDSNVGSSLSRCYIYDFGVLLEDYIVPNFDDLNSQEIDEILTQVEILLTLQNIDNTWDSAYGNSGGVEMPMLGPLAKLGQGLLLLSEKIEDAGLVIQIQNAVQNLVNAIMGNAVSPSAWTLSVPHQTTTYTVYRQTPYSDDFANPEENSRFAQLLLSLYDLNTASNMVYLRAAEDIFSAWARYTGADAATFAFDPNGLPVWSLANWEGAEGQVEFRKLAHRLYYNYSDAIQPETQSLLDALFTAEWVLSNDTWTNATWGVDNVTYNWSVNPGETTTTISHALLKQFHADGLEHNELMPVWTELTGNNASALLDSSEFAVEEGYPDIADTLYAEAGNSVLTLNNLCSPEFGLPAIIGPEGFGQTAQWPYPGTPYIYMPLAHHVDNAYAWNAANSLIRLRYSGFIDSLQPSSSQAELLSSAA